MAKHTKRHTFGTRTRARTGLVAAVIVILTGTLGTAMTAAPEPRPLGDTAMPGGWYEAHQRTFATDDVSFPASYDWRDEGAVTAARDQGACAGSWAFAAVGVLESKALIRDGRPVDLSEQQLLACAQASDGCNGGTMQGLQYYRTSPPVAESCGGGNVGAARADHTSVDCSAFSSCPAIDTPPASGFYTVDTANVEQMKASLYWDGPAYLRFDVEPAFFAFWESAPPQTVYKSRGFELAVGGHAVLLIGWSDARQAWLAKNSWGAEGGPNRDGTFWLAYSALRRLTGQMANLRPACGPTAPGAKCMPAADQHHEVGQASDGGWMAAPGTVGVLSQAMHGSRYGHGACWAELQVWVGPPSQDPPYTILEVDVDEDCVPGQGAIECHQQHRYAIPWSMVQPSSVNTVVVPLKGDPCHSVVRTTLRVTGATWIVHHGTCIQCAQ